MDHAASSLPAPSSSGSQTPDWADEAERRVLDAAVALAPDLGWNDPMAARAAALAGLSAGEAELLLPHGALDLAALLSHRHDQTALDALAGIESAGLKIRARIAAGVGARLDATLADAAATRRLAGFLALPANLPLAARLTWDSAEALWRWAGDRATDENHYSKRAILSAVLVSTLAVGLAQGREAAQTYLSARIDNVMAFETWKAKLKPPTLPDKALEALTRLRYGRG